MCGVNKILRHRTGPSGNEKYLLISFLVIGRYTLKMSDFISVVNRISAIVQNNKNVDLESKNLNETITTIVECLEKEGLDLGRVARRWRREPKLQDEMRFRELREEGDKLFQQKQFDKALTKYKWVNYNNVDIV